MLCHRHFFNSAKEWAHSRYISYTLYCVNSAKGKKLSLGEYMPLLIDQHDTAETIYTDDEKQSLLEIATERANFIPK